MWIDRQIKDRVNRCVQSRPAVLLTGARQTGKSTLLQHMFPDTPYVTFDYLQQVEAAREAPEQFLSRFQSPVILDEIQYVPELFRELKIVIDTHRDRYGHWIMTGSQQFSLMEQVSESLAGRIALLRLETLSAMELRQADVSDPGRFLYRGGYPELWANPHLTMTDYFESYVRTYVERDLKTIIDVKNLSDFRRFFRVAATRAGQLLNYRGLAADVGVSDVTIKKWVHALEISGLIYLLPPFYANIGKRLIKSPKLYFGDHGLLCHLLGIDSETQWHDHPHKGSLWENLVMMELIKTLGLDPGTDLFFYRDQNGVEIDFVIEKNDRLILVEAKAGERPVPEKLNFSRVTPLLNSRYRSASNLLALNMPGKEVLPRRQFMCFNPLHTSPAAAFADT
jgi:predicted AAA+ superfamily ATPase